MTDQQFRVTEKQIQDASTTFHLFDHKGNKTVLTKHLGQVFRSLGLHVPDDKVKDWSDEVDEEATGEITFEQFLPLFEMKLKEDEDERELREAFRVLDKNKKGVIDVADLRWLLKSLGDDLTDEEIEAMIIETDTDGSGTVDYEDSDHVVGLPRRVFKADDGLTFLNHDAFNPCFTKMKLQQTDVQYLE